MSNQFRLTLALSLCGSLAFIAGAAILWFGPATYASPALQAISTCAAIILSFRGGIQAGIGVSIGSTAPKSAQSIYLLSIAPALLAWAMLFIDAPSARLIVAIFLFVFVWVIDALLLLQKLIPDWHFRVRSVTTCVTVAALMAALIRT